MDQRLKNVMGGAIVLVVLVFGYAAMSYVSSYGKSIAPSSFRSFTVSGDGKATAVPDIAEFSFQVVTEGGKDIGTLQTTNTDAMNKAIAFVKSEGVADKDIKTGSYDINPRYQTYNCNQTPVYTSGVAVATVACPPASIVGYTVTQSVDVKVRDFAKIGDIMSGVVKNGANDVGSLSFTLDDPTTVQNEARADAITKAKAEAQAIAQESGFKIGRLLSVQESGGYRQVYNTAYAESSLKAVPSASVPVIQAGSQDVTETMVLQYEIE
jgi:uncharacterized protein YggE